MLQKIETTGIGKCSIHGDYEIKSISIDGKIVFSDVINICPECERIVMDVKKEKEKKLNLKKQNEKMLNNGVFKAYLNARIEDYKLETDITIVKKFAEYPQDKILVLYGKNGTGKTWLASALCIQFCGLYFTMYNLTNKAFDSPKAKNIVRKKCHTTPLLVIDEIGKQSITKAESNLFYDIINTRLGYELPTVLVSNLDKIQDFNNFVGLSIYDRLCQFGIYQELQHKSYRQRELFL